MSAKRQNRQPLSVPSMHSRSARVDWTAIVIVDTVSRLMKVWKHYLIVVVDDVNTYHICIERYPRKFSNILGKNAHDLLRLGYVRSKIDNLRLQRLFQILEGG